MKTPNMLDAKKRNQNDIKYVKYNKEFDKFGNGKKFFVRTYGCQMNEHDSEKIKGMLKSVDFSEGTSVDDADIVILNTCAIRENAHDKVFGFLGVLKHLKQSKPDLLIGLCGCMAQEEVVVNDILNKYKYVDFVCGTHNLDNMLSIIKNKIDTDKRQIEVLSYEGDVVEGVPVVRDSKYSAWIDIIYGCDKFCTYCIVPYTRGTQRSRKHEDIVEEVKKLVSDGYKEVTLLGQNVNAYGKDLYKDYDLSNLLSDVSDTGIERIRFVTSHPWDFTDKMIDVIASRDNIMPYIHLPLQSGSNKILKLMNRKYTSEEYLKLYNSIREKVADSSVTTDIIVGFPGETEEDFLETLNLVEECKFDGAFTFAYSPRENTPAALMKDAIPEEVKMDRLHRLNEVVNKYSNLRNQKLLGTTVKCLVIGESEKDKNKVCGYTENMKLVNIEGPKSLIGNIVSVKITDTKSFSLDGEYIKE
ncbi:MAG: tRNA (N6-isopentenyl adenosine(37)-C2)-methylthiotransferase MiaB [Tenericutes bacterium]|nr:tRNA (N6-isopentenyl adenosine(37)-C2)-methylthiotransferase MiaB [Mycoplasmatota bacterium]